ncbi:MAG: class I SAM-dependent methyltransferase [Candidatus Riflebacteria bacterium HGW-Riflebacteria-2]|jgi:SAM-dependent methyltransferase|nr:MAG: class I SAM-dependent methyltransferase [Candidatus Riflebacteria bacterium HGW-Riflebacteria-2]
MQTFDKQWNQVHGTRNWGRYPAEELVRFMARNYYNQCREQIRVLDLGCGTGANTWFLCREGFSTVAFDGSFIATQKAAAFCSELKAGATFLQADAGMLPFSDTSFDVVADIGAISANNRQGIRQILAEICRVLKPGGRVFSSVLFTTSTSGYKTGEKIDGHSYRNVDFGPVTGLGTIHFFSRAEINGLWQQAGFDKPVIDVISRTDHGGSQRVSFYTASARKPGGRHV